MTTTAQALIDLARLPLNDAAKVRYTDADALKHLNAILRDLQSYRADLFIGGLSTPFTDLILANTVPVDDAVIHSVADMLSGRMVTIDDDADLQTKAAMFLGFAKGALYGGG
jgi:hypothetical protein